MTPNPNSKRLEITLLKNLAKTLRDKETFWHMKSCISLLTFGDTNTMFFFTPKIEGGRTKYKQSKEGMGLWTWDPGEIMD